jgi:hypothetical protein
MFLKEPASLVFSASYTWLRIVRFHLWGGLNIAYLYNKAARRRQHNLQNPLNNTVQQDAKI